MRLFFGCFFFVFDCVAFATRFCVCSYELSRALRRADLFGAAVCIFKGRFRTDFHDAVLLQILLHRLLVVVVVVVVVVVLERATKKNTKN